MKNYALYFLNNLTKTVMCGIEYKLSFVSQETPIVRINESILSGDKVKHLNKH